VQILNKQIWAQLCNDLLKLQEATEQTQNSQGRAEQKQVGMAQASSASMKRFQLNAFFWSRLKWQLKEIVTHRWEPYLFEQAHLAPLEVDLKSYSPKTRLGRLQATKVAFRVSKTRYLETDEHYLNIGQCGYCVVQNIWSNLAYLVSAAHYNMPQLGRSTHSLLNNALHSGYFCLILICLLLERSLWFPASNSFKI